MLLDTDSDNNIDSVGLFLDASSHLYKRVCPSVRRSVRRSVGPSVGPLVGPLRLCKNRVFSGIWSSI